MAALRKYSAGKVCVFYCILIIIHICRYHPLFSQAEGATVYIVNFEKLRYC